MNIKRVSPILARDGMTNLIVPMPSDVANNKPCFQSISVGCGDAVGLHNVLSAGLGILVRPAVGKMPKNTKVSAGVGRFMQIPDGIEVGTLVTGVTVMTTDNVSSSTSTVSLSRQIRVIFPGRLATAFSSYVPPIPKKTLLFFYKHLLVGKERSAEKVPPVSRL